LRPGQRVQPEAGAASVGWRPGLRRRAACRGSLAGRVHRRIFARRQPVAARPHRGELPGRERHDRGAREARARHHRARGFPQETHGAGMKALFLGNVAADTAEGITAELPDGLECEVIADPQGLRGRPEAAAAADILVSNHWRPDYPPAPKLRLVQSVATGIELFDLAALPRGCAVCNSFGHETAIAEYVIMAMLALHHRFFEIAGEFRERGSWRSSWVESGAPHGEVRGSTLGIVGYGRVGREVAKRAVPFGVRILAANRSPR